MVYRYEHAPPEPLTVGRLSLRVTGLDDSTPIEVVVPTGPSTECGIGDGPPLIPTGASGDWTVDLETGRPHLTPDVDYPAGRYCAKSRGFAWVFIPPIGRVVPCRRGVKASGRRKGS